MEQTLLFERLARAEKYVADGRRRLDCQRELILLIKESGRNAEDAENLLEQMAAAHALNRAKLRRVKAAIGRLNACGDRRSSAGGHARGGPSRELKSLRADFPLTG